MPNTKSAKKALTASLKKRDYNLEKKSKIKNSLKELRRVLSTTPDNFQEALSKVYSTLDKAVKTKFIKKNKADRKKARMAALVKKVLNPSS